MRKFGFIWLALVLLLGWMIAWVVLHVASALIHVLLLLALLSVGAHFFRSSETG